MKCAIYSRKSKATEKGESIENQIQMCKEYVSMHIERHSKTPVEAIDVYIDDGFSAKDTNRPKFKTLMERVAKKEYAYVLCYRLDRISRNICDFSNIIEFLNKNDASFISVKENFDTSTPAGRMMMYITSIFAQMERETIAERVRDNMLLLSKTGRWLGGRTPFGFDSERKALREDDGRKKQYSQLVVNPMEAEIVRLIYEKYLELGTLVAVRGFLISSNIKTRAGRHFGDTTIKQLLSNPVNCTADQAAYDYFTRIGAEVPHAREEFDGLSGLMPFNRHSNTKGFTEQREPSDWVVSVAQHQGIVSGETFVKAQRKLNENRDKYKGFTQVRNNYALLSGIVYCKHCGSKLYPRPQNKNDGKRTKSADSYFYVCDKRRSYSADVCECRYLHGVKADAAVVNEILRFSEPNSTLKQQLEKLKDAQTNKRQAKSMIGVYRSQLDAKQKAIDRLVMSLATADLGETSRKYIDAQINVLDREITEIKDSLRMEEMNIEQTESVQSKVAQISDRIVHFAENFDSLSIDEKRSLLGQVLDRVEWDGKQLDIFSVGIRA